MAGRGQEGAIVTLLDAGERYRHTYFDDAWLQAQGLDCRRESDAIDALIDRGDWPEELRRTWRLAGDPA